MQTVETLNEGLKRAYTLTITAAEITAKVDEEVKRVAPQVRMPGFRPGKVPANLVRKMHGEALSQDALNNSIQQGVQGLIAERKLRPAIAPQVALEGEYAAGSDATVSVTLEVLPDVPAPAIDGLTLERLSVPADEAVVDAQLNQLASQSKRHKDAPEGHEAATGDLVVMDFVGKVDDVAFEGGTGEGMSVEIGSGRLIPGFEDQLVGVRAGDEKQIAVTFPEDYQAENLKGKAATFDLKITDVRVAEEGGVDDEFAKSLGLESLEQLRGLIKGQVEQELNGLTRTHMKRKLLDQLAAGHDFDVPPSMVDAEFEQIWQQLQHETTHEADPAAAQAELENEREDYRAIAVRRVRLGLLLSEIGQANGIEVSQQEMQRLILQAAQQYPQKDRERFMQYVQQEPMAAAQLRAPLYEDKVVDFLFGRAEITDREVTREELEAAIESEDGFASGTHIHNHDHDHDHAGHDHDYDHVGHDHGDHDHADAEPVNAEAAEPMQAADIEPAAPDSPAEPAAPKKKAATRKAPAATGEAGEAAPAKKPRAKKKTDTDEA